MSANGANESESGFQSAQSKAAADTLLRGFSNTGRGFFLNVVPQEMDGQMRKTCQLVLEEHLTGNTLDFGNILSTSFRK